MTVENPVLQNRCTVQAKFFLAARRDEALIDALAAVLCVGLALRSLHSAALLATAIAGFVCAYGRVEELSMDVFCHMLRLADESVGESALDAMFRQIERGEFYDKRKHAWVKHSIRKPQPDVACVLAYRSFKECPAPDRADAVRLLRVSTARLGEYPGWEYLAAALLADRGAVGDGCPPGCGCYAVAASRLSRALSVSSRRLPSAELGSAEAYVADTFECLRGEAERSVLSGERMRVEDRCVPEGAATVSERAAGEVLGHLRGQFCPKACEDLRAVMGALGLQPG